MPSETGVSGASGSASGGGGGGGGADPATATNQTLTLTALDTIYDALALVGLEATNVQIRDAVTGLGAGSTLADLAAAFSSDALVQADILTALEASEIDIDAIKTGIDLLVPDLDAIRVEILAMNGKIPASPAVDRTAANAPSAVRQSNGTSFVDLVLDTTVVAGNAILAAIRDRLPAALVNGRLSVDVGATAGLTNTQLRASTVPVSGTGASTPATSVSIANALVSANAVGAIASAQFGVLKASAGRLVSLRIESASAGTFYLQFHDATTTGAIAAGTIQGLGYAVSGVGDEFVVALEAPLSFASGIAWALSTTKNAYTAAVGKAAFVEGIWA